MPTSTTLLSTDDFLQLIRVELKNYHLFNEEPHPKIMKLRAIKNQLETQSQPNASFAKRLALNTILHQALDETYKESKDHATLLRKRFLDKETIPAAADYFHISQATVSRWTDRAMEIVVAKFLDIEKGANETWYNRLTARLPARRYDRLVGVDHLRDQLVEKIVDPNGPGVIVLSGIGGIGKSSLADYVVRKALRSGRFHKVAWVAPQSEHGEWLLVPGSIQEQFVSILAHEVAPGAGPLSFERQIERLADRLKRESHLIVIDSLEEQHETDAIIQYLNGVENPSRFIITTRAQPSRATCRVVNLGELSREHSLNLMQYYLESTGQTQIGQVDEETLSKIFMYVGGNPLALKITAGLMQWMPLEKILADLAKGEGNAGVIYKKIFWYTWETLSAESQLLLQAISSAGKISEVSAAQMQEASGLASESFWRAVDELLLRSMLDVRGPIDDRRYGIHRLTDTFIETEIAA